MTARHTSIKADLLNIKVGGRLPSKLFVAEEHYHLRQAGVRVVMENTIDAMTQYLPVKEIDVFVFSDYENIFSISDLKIKPDGGGRKKVRIHKIDIAELNYDEENTKNKMEFIRKASHLKEKIHDNIPWDKCSKKNPFILHCHGLPLGKNPFLSMAINMLAEEAFHQKKPLWVLNQVHDFAENSRPEMLYRVQHCTGKYNKRFAAEIMYPNSPNIFYITINSRDAENLKMIGIAPQRIFFLPNSIDTEFFTDLPIITNRTGVINNRYTAQILARIKEYSTKKHYFFDEKRKILLSPLKVMRRKNNVETILILMALNNLRDEHQLLITLEPGSGKDVDYANAIRKFIQVNRLPVVIGLGNDLISSNEQRDVRWGKAKTFNLIDIFALSKAIITNSIIEGFGFGFHEGWLTGKTIVGRKLPYVCKDFERNGMKLEHMYKKMWVRLEWMKNAEKRLRDIYYKDANNLRKRQGLKSISKQTIERYVKNVKFYKVQNHKCIDFKDLSLEMQFEAIKTIFADNKRIKEFIGINPSIKKIYNMMRENPKNLIAHNKKVVMQRYNLKAKSKRLQNIFKIGNQNYLKKIKHGKVNNSKVIAKYLDLDYIHPLTVD
tara:strand:+ start:1478 stop:3295 length:1818 start_codon:yes stop_codon:yes gene_type:complete